MPKRPKELNQATRAFSDRNWSKCVTLFEAGRYEEPAAPTADDWGYYGESLYHLGRYNEAVEACSNALRITNSCERAGMYRYESYRRLGKWREALGDANFLIARFGETAKSVNRRALVLDELGRTKEALQDFTQAVVLEKTNPEYQWNLARQWEVRDDYRRALKHYGIAFMRYTGADDLKACQDKITALEQKAKAEATANLKEREEKKNKTEKKAEKKENDPMDVDDASTESDDEPHNPKKKRKISMSLPMEDKPRAAKRMKSDSTKDWTVEQVSAWIRGIGPAFETYAKAVKDNGVDGPTLLAANSEFFKELGVNSLVHRTRLLTSVASMRKEGKVDEDNALPLANADSDVKKGVPEKKPALVPIKVMPDKALESMPDKALESMPDKALESMLDKALKSMPDKALESMPKEKPPDKSPYIFPNHRENPVPEVMVGKMLDSMSDKKIPEMMTDLLGTWLVGQANAPVVDPDIQCCVCQDARKCVLFDPCGHMTVCEPCSKSPHLTRCPNCRAEIKTRRKVFV